MVAILIPEEAIPQLSSLSARERSILYRCVISRAVLFICIIAFGTFSVVLFLVVIVRLVSGVWEFPRVAWSGLVALGSFLIVVVLFLTNRQYEDCFPRDDSTIFLPAMAVYRMKGDRCPRCGYRLHRIQQCTECGLSESTMLASRRCLLQEDEDICSDGGGI